jgi:hypothetical protein
MEGHHDKNPHNQVKVAIVQKTDSFPPEQHFQHKQGSSNGPLPISKILQSCAMTNLVENIIHNTHHCGMYYIVDSQLAQLA